MSETTPRRLSFVMAMLAGATLMASGIVLGAAAAVMLACPR